MGGGGSIYRCTFLDVYLRVGLFLPPRSCSLLRCGAADCVASQAAPCCSWEACGMNHFFFSVNNNFTHLLRKFVNIRFIGLGDNLNENIFIFSVIETIFHQSVVWRFSSDFFFFFFLMLQESLHPEAWKQGTPTPISSPSLTNLLTSLLLVADLVLLLRRVCGVGSNILGTREKTPQDTRPLCSEVKSLRPLQICQPNHDMSKSMPGPGGEMKLKPLPEWNEVS